MPSESSTQRLASLLLKEPVVPWIEQRREAGKSWRDIGDDLRALTGGQIDVKHQTLVNWVQRAQEQAEQPTEQAAAS